MQVGKGRGWRRAVVPFIPRRDSQPVQGEHLPLPELWRRVWAVRGATDLANPNTAKNYRRCEELSRHLPDFPNRESIELWRAALTASMSPGTVYNHLAVLGGVFKFAQAHGWCPVNPVEQVMRHAQPPGPESRPIRNIAKVWPTIARVAKDRTEAALLGVFRFTGVRKEEAIALMPDDVVKREGGRWLLSVVRQRSNVNSWTTRPPKGRKQRGKRFIPVRPELRELLAPVLDGWQPVQLRLGTREQPRTVAEVPFLFPYREADMRDLRQRLGALLPEFFGPGQAFHSFRHTCAYELYTGGVAVPTISEWLGHESVLTTEKYLAGMAGGVVRDDHALDQFFKPGGEDRSGVRAPSAVPVLPAAASPRVGPLRWGSDSGAAAASAASVVDDDGLPF